MLKFLSKTTAKTFTRFPSRPFSVIAQNKPDVQVSILK